MGPDEKALGEKRGRAQSASGNSVDNSEINQLMPGGFFESLMYSASNKKDCQGVMTLKCRHEQVKTTLRVRKLSSSAEVLNEKFCKCGYTTSRHTGFHD